MSRRTPGSPRPDPLFPYTPPVRSVLSVRDSRLGQVPIAVVEIVEGAQTSEQDLKDFVRSQMPAYMVPTSIELVDALPRTLSMKVDRPALRALFQDKYHF